MTLQTLRTELDGPVLTVRIDNPPTDLMDAAVVADLLQLGRRLSADATVRAVVITGPRPGVFVPHFLIDEILAGTEALGMPTPYVAARTALAAVSLVRRVPGGRQALVRTPAAGLLQLADTHEALGRLTRLPQVVVAAIDGDAQGGGCELALACDVRVMSDGPYLIGLPELSAGIPPGAGGTQRLMAAVGAARARAMILTAHTLAPREALAAGLVDEVTSDDQTLSRAVELAHATTRWNPASVRAAKRALRPGGLRGGLAREAGGFVSSVSGATAIDQLRDFVAASDSAGGRTPWRDRSGLPGR